jgi:hypothetical protein
MSYLRIKFHLAISLSARNPLADIAGTVASMIESELGALSEELPTTPLC